MWFQSKVEEAEFNDVPAGNCDIPDTSAVLMEVIWKTWTWKESTKTIQIFPEIQAAKRTLTIN